MIISSCSGEECKWVMSLTSPVHPCVVLAVIGYVRDLKKLMPFVILILLAHFHCLPCFVLFSVATTVLFVKKDGRMNEENQQLIESINRHILSLKSRLPNMDVDDLSDALCKFTQSKVGQEKVRGVLNEFHHTKVCVR